MRGKISFSGVILVGSLLFCVDLSAQRLCRNNSTGAVRWVAKNCPSGFTNITNSVRSEYLRANSVTTAKIQNGAVTDAKIAGVSASKVDFTNWTAPEGSVITDSIADSAVTNDKLAGGITEDKLAGNISWSKINVASIPAGSIPQSKIDFSGFTVPANSVGTTQIQDNAVTNQKLAGSIDWSKINSGSIPVAAIDHTRINFSGFSVPAGSVGTGQIVDGAVTDAKLAGNISWSRINVASIPDSSISHTKIDFSGYTLPANSVGNTQLQDNAVNSAKIDDGTITNDDISATANIDWSKIDANSIQDSSISHMKINFSNWTAPAGSVNSNSVADGTLTADDLADDAVDTAEIKDGAVTNTKIDINTAQPLPYHTFLSTVNLTTTGYIPLIGYNFTPLGTQTGLTASNKAFNCSSGTLTVVLDNAPGTGNSRTFELKDGPNTISGSTININDNNTQGTANITNIPPNANLVLYANVSGAPAPARATIYFVCK